MEIKVGEIIRAKRLEKKYTLAGLAQAVGISTGYLSQLENGRKANPKLEVVLRIIKELDLDIDMLLGLDSPGENLNLKIPSLFKLTIAKDRNSKALEDKDVLKKLCGIVDRMLESKYVIEDRELYSLFLEDIYIYSEAVTKRYLALQAIRNF